MSWLGRIGNSRMFGACGAGLAGAYDCGCPGGFGAARLGMRLVIDPDTLGDIAPGGPPRGIGGGARGFSKLLSWFCGNLGLAGGEIMPIAGG